MNRLNLIPRAVRIARARRRHVQRWFIATTIGAAAVALPLGTDWYHSAEADSLISQGARIHAELARVGEESRSLRTETAQLSLRLERADALRSKRAWSGMFALIASCTPADCWLTEIATDPDVPAAGGSRVLNHRGSGVLPAAGETQDNVVYLEAPRKLRISGYGSNAVLPNTFVTNLKNKGVFTRVTLERSVMELRLGRSYLRFVIVCEW